MQHALERMQFTRRSELLGDVEYALVNNLTSLPLDAVGSTATFGYRADLRIVA